MSSKSEIIDFIDEKIEVAKSNIRICMNDYGRKGDVNADYPDGFVHEHVGKAEVYHRGGLYRLLELKEFIEEYSTK